MLNNPTNRSLVLSSSSAAIVFVYSFDLAPMEFIGRLVSLVPKPRVNLTRFHGVFSPNSRLRKQIIPEQPVRGESGFLGSG